MNKALQDFSKARALPYDSGTETVYGSYNGYDVTLENKTNTEVCIKLSVKSASEQAEDVNARLRSFLEFLQQSNAAVTFAEYKGYQITLYIKAKKAKEGALIDQILNQLTDHLVKENMLICCQYCGKLPTEGEVVRLGVVGGNTVETCDSCMTQISSSLEESKKGGNIVLGIIGAVIASLAGVILWVILWQIGFIAGLAGAVMFTAAYKAYTTLSKKNDRFGVFLSVIIAIVMIFVAQTICYLGDKSQESREMNGYVYSMDDYMNRLERLPRNLMADPATQTYFVFNLGMGYLLMLVSTVSTIKQEAKKAKAANQVYRL